MGQTAIILKMETVGFIIQIGTKDLKQPALQIGGVTYQIMHFIQELYKRDKENEKEKDKDKEQDKEQDKEKEKHKI